MGVLVAAGKNSTLMGIAANTALDLGVYPFTDVWGGISETNITDYSGFIYDPTNHCMLMFGGGHAATMADYVVRLKLNAASSLEWELDYARTANSAMTTDNVGAGGIWTSTGLPISRHTYDMMASKNGTLILLTNSLLAGESLSFNPGTYAGDVKAAHYNASAKTWSLTSYGPFPWYYASACSFDPVSGKVLIAGPNPNAGSPYKLWLYNPDTQTVETGPEITNAITNSMNLVYCDDDDKFYYLLNDGTVYVIVLDRNTLANSTCTEVTGITGTPPSASQTGWDWDNWNHIIGGGVTAGKFYGFDPSAKTWTEKTVQGGSVGSVSVSHALAFDRINGVFVFIDTSGNQAGNTWAYRYA